MFGETLQDGMLQSVSKRKGWMISVSSVSFSLGLSAINDSWESRAEELVDTVGRYRPSGGGFGEASVVMVEKQVGLNGC